MIEQDFGRWPLVIANSLLLIVFAGSFFHPRCGRDWRAMGAYSAFIVALFAAMYGAPRTVYMLATWLGSRLPALQATHSGGHLWNDLSGWKGDPHLSPFHLISYAVLMVGFWLIATVWMYLMRAARDDRLATTGPYAWVRHPQYLGFLAIMVGFLLRWPTLPTLVVFPVLVHVYWRLARAEEREVADRYPDDWPVYARRVHRLRPRRPADSPSDDRPQVGNRIDRPRRNIMRTCDGTSPRRPCIPVTASITGRGTDLAERPRSGSPATRSGPSESLRPSAHRIAVIANGVERPRSSCT